MAKLLEAVDLVTNFYTYEGVVKALDSVSLNIDHGITFGLVGESGCGKSVFVRSMMRIIQEPGSTFIRPPPAMRKQLICCSKPNLTCGLYGVTASQ
jgi:ABC-type dipeptide/oligopeptide/nickel transport system ATPase component